MILYEYVYIYIYKYTKLDMWFQKVANQQKVGELDGTSCYGALDRARERSGFGACMGIPEQGTYQGKWKNLACHEEISHSLSA